MTKIKKMLILFPTGFILIIFVFSIFFFFADRGLYFEKKRGIL
jgi:hypothetical protein